jgi:hypothetical protein
MTEDKMDEMVKRAAASYNRPPDAVPRDEMWAAISAERSAGPRIIYGHRGAPRFAGITRNVWLGAAAAALLVTAGVEVGRWSVPSAPVTQVASAPPAKILPAASTDTSVPTGIVAPVTIFPRGSRGAARSPDARTESTSRDTQPIPSASQNREQTAYRLVTLTHLSDAEAMLTSFRSHTDEKMDAAMAKWARDLLTNTRLLLDSPAAADPRRRQLLEDLELTLVDIVQLSPNAGAQDRQMIEKNLDQGHVLTRLRTAIPAGMQKGS